MCASVPFFSFLFFKFPLLYLMYSLRIDILLFSLVLWTQLKLETLSVQTTDSSTRRTFGVFHPSTTWWSGLPPPTPPVTSPTCLHLLLTTNVGCVTSSNKYSLSMTSGSLKWHETSGVVMLGDLYHVTHQVTSLGILLSSLTSIATTHTHSSLSSLSNVTQYETMTCAETFKL